VTIRDVLNTAHRVFCLKAHPGDLSLLCRPLEETSKQKWLWMKIEDEVWGNLSENMEYLVGGDSTEVDW